MGIEKQKTILLVEDEAISAMAEKMMLEKYGYNVITALSGEEAVTAVETTTAIDLILMDINLGSGMDGTDAAAIILREHDIPVVFLSSHMEPEVVAKTEKITSYGYVVKDSSITVLDASIKMAFKLFEAKMKEREKESQREAAFAALRENEQLLNFHVNNSPLATIELTSDLTVKRWSGEAEKIFGWNQSETIGKPLRDLKMIYDEDIPIVQEIMKRLGEGSSKNIVSSNRNYTKQGKVIICEWYNSVLLNPQGKLISIMSRGIDISKRKRTEERLRESEERYRTLVEHASDLVFWTDKMGNFTYVNKAAVHISGYEEGELIGRLFTFLIRPDMRVRALKFYAIQLRKRIFSSYFEIPLIRKDGREVWLGQNAQLIIADGQVTGFQAVARDVTMRKQVESQRETALAALQVSLEKYRVLFESFPLAITISDKSGKIIEGNSQADQLLGITRDVHTQRSIDGKEWQIVRKDGTPMPAAEYASTRALQENRLIKNVEMGIVKDKGEITWISVTAAPILLEDYGVAVTYGDISERKQEEEMLRESEERFKVALKFSSIIVAVADRDLRYTWIYNPHPSFNPLTVIGKRDDELAQNDGVKRLMQLKEQVIKTGIGMRDEIAFPLTDGLLTYDITAEPLRDAAGQLIGVTTAAMNITRLKSAEDEIQRQLAEKEILLKEVHHRIKNNIASIGGLISLRLQSITNPESIAVLKDAGSRVDSMRLLYDKLLLTKDYEDLSVKNYLDDLIDTVVTLFPDQVKIKLDRQIADFDLDSKQLFPLGLIINELLTNAIKYAFIDRKTGSIKISVTKVDNHVALTVQDNGLGLPAGFDITKVKGFGLMLVKMLSQQLGGSFSIKKRKGTICKIEFDILRPGARGEGQ